MKRAVVLLLILTLGYASAYPLPGAINFLSQSSVALPTDRVDEAALTLMVLPAEDPVVENYTLFLLSIQNPDGGWGYYRGSVSSVPSTAYAVLGLLSVRDIRAEGAAYRGILYLRTAFNGEAWGYIPGSPSEFYPTAMALWALGVAGYNMSDYYVSRGVQYLRDATPANAMEAALRMIAFHHVGAEVEGEILPPGDTLELAVLAYALALSDRSFETAKTLAMLETRAIVFNDTYTWRREWPFYSDSVLTTAYAALAYKTFLEGEYYTLYDRLLDLVDVLAEERVDGHWSFNASVNCTQFSTRDVKFTYYAATALMRWEKGVPPETLEWAREELPSAMATAEKRGTVTEDYYYLLRLLIEANNLTPSEARAHARFIESLQLPEGAWRGTPYGPQPLETAMAVELLVELGSVEPALRGKEWLLSVSNDGWGIYIQTPYTGFMLTKDVLTTSHVVRAIAPIASGPELKAPVEWLLSQGSDGAWAVVKDYYWLFRDTRVPVKPSVETTVMAAEALERAGVQSRETVSWLVERLDSMSTYELALALHYLAGKVEQSAPSLDYVLGALNTGEPFVLTYDPAYGGVATVAAAAINPVNVSAGIELEEDVNYVVIGDFDSLDVESINPYINYRFVNGTITINGRAYRADLVVIPGRIGRGRVLAVLGDERVAETLFRTGLVRYLSGPYIVLVDTGGQARLEDLQALG